MRHVLLLMTLAIVLPGCAIAEYARYADGDGHGTIYGHDVYLRQTQIIDGKPIQVAYVKVDDFVDERNRQIQVLRAYYLPKHSPAFVKVYEVPVDRSAGFAASVNKHLREMVKQEEHNNRPKRTESKDRVPQEQERPRPNPVPEKSGKADRDEELKKELTSIFAK